MLDCKTRCFYFPPKNEKEEEEKRTTGGILGVEILLLLNGNVSKSIFLPGFRAENCAGKGNKVVMVSGFFFFHRTFHDIFGALTE